MATIQEKVPAKVQSGLMNALKAGLVVLLVLILCIPLEMIKSVAREREERRDEARSDITEKAGGSSVLGAVSVVVPVSYVERFKNEKGKEEIVWRSRKVWFLPEELAIDGTTETALRKRGIYEVPVFSGPFGIRASFRLHPAMTGLDSAVPEWDRAQLVMEFQDSRSLKRTPVLVQGESRRPMKPSQDEIILNGQAISAPIALTRVGDTATVAAKASIDLELSGALSLRFVSMGAETSVRLSGNWPSPSFSGYRLPDERSLGPNGFSASWTSGESARALPAALFQNESNSVKAMETSFGLEYYVPTDVYQKTHRALRYGVLFLLIPFAGLFLLESILKFKIHPIQYALIGAADLIFYLLLLSVSEHIPFYGAYLASATAVTALIGVYARGAFRAERKALLIAPIIAVQYGYLFFALESEDYALLIGAVGLFLILAVVMILTRGFDWYEARLRGKKNGKSPENPENSGEKPGGSVLPA